MEILAGELASKKRMARAKEAMSKAMGDYLQATPESEHLTAVEWSRVLQECQDAMIRHALVGEWAEAEGHKKKEDDESDA